LQCDNFDCGKSFAFCIQTEHLKSTPRKKMWQTQDERKLLLVFMQLFQQRLQGLHLRSTEKNLKNKNEEKRQKEKGGKTKNQTIENAMGQTVVAQETNVWPV